jgi:hypothetical protein
MDFLALYITRNPLIPACCFDPKIIYIQSNFVYDAYMNGDRNAVTQLYRVIQVEGSVFCEMTVSVAGPSGRAV